MNEAKLLLWGKVDVEEWNSHKFHQRLVKSFGQRGRQEMAISQKLWHEKYFQSHVKGGDEKAQPMVVRTCHDFHYGFIWFP